MVRRGRFSSQDGAPDYQKGEFRSMEMYTQSHPHRSKYKQTLLHSNAPHSFMLEFFTQS